MKKYIIIFLTCAVAGCSPGKKLLKEQAAIGQLNGINQKERAEIAAAAVMDYVKNNPCIPEPAIDLDSLCYLYYACPENADSGKQYFPAAAAEKKTKTILVPWEDTRTKKLLQDSINEKDKRLAVAVALISAGDSKCQAAKIAAVQKVKGHFKTLAIVSGSVLLLLILIILLLIRALRKSKPLI